MRRPQRVPAVATAMTAIVTAACIATAACGPATGGGGGGGDDDDAPTIDAGVGVDAVAVPENAAIYAHTSAALYRVDPDTLAVSMVGNFGGQAAGNAITDLAIDSSGAMIGISYDQVFSIDPTTAAGTRIGSGSLDSYNGLSFVPSQLAFGTAGPDVLVATQSVDGTVFRIDPITGAATAIGNMGGYTSSGDIVAVTGYGIVATVTNGGDDLLVRLAPSTFAATPIGTGIGFPRVWGVGYWRDRVFGFSADGQFIGIDTTTGVGTAIQNSGVSWWGAAVTTAAPIIR